MDVDQPSPLEQDQATLGKAQTISQLNNSCEMTTIETSVHGIIAYESLNYYVLI